MRIKIKWIKKVIIKIVLIVKKLKDRAIIKKLKVKQKKIQPLY